MSEKFTYDVFISYSSQDKAIVHPLAERLRDDGVKVWLDAWVLKPGDPISLKIQQGLEQSRVLLMCMSKAYFHSDWTTLEHHTLLFRDPTNEQRRFVPLLLEDCERPDVIAQFLHVDWREPNDEAHRNVFRVCRQQNTLRHSTSSLVEDASNLCRQSISSSVAIPVEQPITQASFSPNGQFIATGSQGGTVAVWKASDLSRLSSISAHSHAVTAIYITADSRSVITGAVDGSITIWNVQKNEQGRCQTLHQGRIGALAATKDGYRLISGSEDGTVKVWEIHRSPTLSRTLEAEGSTNSWIEAVAIMSDGLRIRSMSFNGEANEWDLRTRKRLSAVWTSLTNAETMTLDSKGSRAVVGFGDGRVEIWNIEQRELEMSFDGHHLIVLSVAMSADGSMAASASADKTIKLWNLEERCLLQTLEGHEAPIDTIAFSPGNIQLVSGGRDQSLRVWRI